MALAKNNFKSYTLFATVIMLISSIAGYYILNTAFTGQYFNAFPYLCGFFYAISLLFYYFIARERSKREDYAQLLLGLSGGKFIIYIIATLVFIFINRENPVPIAASVFGLYIVYQILELVFILRK